jgi:multidrug efflux system membrane fusion protein
LIVNNKATMRTIKVGNSDKGNTAVQGLNPGDVVANSSFEKLQNGSQITVSKLKLPSTSDSAESDVP